MIHINLVPRETARRQAAWLRYRNYVAILLLAFATLLLGVESWTRRWANEMDVEVETYQSQLSELSRRHQEAKQLEKRRANLQVKLATIGVLERQRRGPAHALEDLAEATPERLWLVEMKEAGGNAAIVGKGLDNQTIAEFMRRLAASDYFSNVDLVEAKQIEEGQAKLKQFTISARVNYSGRPPVVQDPGRKPGGGAAAAPPPGPQQPPPGPQAQAGMPGAPAVPQRVAPVDPSAAVEPAAAAPAAAVTVPLDAARTAAGVSEGRDAATARVVTTGGPPS
ncbi:PilN domain-containing protein [bacterium]|nr:PilN domain-containing protein [bacterium]